MRTILKALLPAAFCIGVVSANAQMVGHMGGAPGGPNFGGEMSKIFGENSAFTATLEMQSADSSGKTMTMPGKISSLDGKSRFEMNMAQIHGGQMSPEAAAHMKAMGIDMNNMVMISRPDEKMSIVVYPGMKAYTERALTDTAATPGSDYKVDSTELGQDTVDGHACIKNKVVVTDKQGTQHTFTVWNASDLKKFPVKIEVNENGRPMTMIFKDVKLDKPDASLFEAPADFKKYDNMGALMREEMIKRMGGAGVSPQGQ